LRKKQRERRTRRFRSHKPQTAVQCDRGYCKKLWSPGECEKHDGTQGNLAWPYLTICPHMFHWSLSSWINTISPFHIALSQLNCLSLHSSPPPQIHIRIKVSRKELPFALILLLSYYNPKNEYWAWPVLRNKNTQLLNEWVSELYWMNTFCLCTAILMCLAYLPECKLPKAALFSVHLSIRYLA